MTKVTSWATMIEIARRGGKLVSLSAFNEFKGTSRLFSRLEEDELLIKSEREKYSFFHPLFVEYLNKL